MNAFSFSRVVLLGLFVLTTVACDGSYYNEDTNELVTLEAAGSESMMRLVARRVVQAAARLGRWPRVPWLWISREV